MGLNQLKMQRKNVGDYERGLSVAAGVALVMVGLRRRTSDGIVLALAGGLAIHRGLTGRCALYSALSVDTATRSENRVEDIKIEHTISLNRARKDVFQFWRKLENLVQIMPRLKKVQVAGDGLSHWEARGPFGQTLCWDARIINEVENELIAWRSLPDSQLSNAGTVRFEDGGNGITHLRVTLAYTPPGGRLGEALAEFLGEEPHKLLREDLERFKSLIEKPSEILTA